MTIKKLPILLTLFIIVILTLSYHIFSNDELDKNAPDVNLAGNKNILGQKRQIVGRSEPDKNYLLSKKYEYALEEDATDLAQLREHLIHQLYQMLKDTNPDTSEVIKVANELVSIADTKSLSALMEAYKETKEDGFGSVELMKAVSRLKNPALINLLEDYAYIALMDHDDSLLGAVSDALANIDTQESADILRKTMSLTPDGDMPYIVGESISKLRNIESIPVLSDIIREQIPGHEGAMEALMNMEGSGVYELAELIKSDERGDLKEKFLQIINKIEYDEELYAAFEELANKSFDGVGEDNIYIYAMEKLEESM